MGIIFAVLRALLYTVGILVVIFTIHYMVGCVREGKRAGHGIFTSLILGFFKLVGTVFLIIVSVGMVSFGAFYMAPKILNLIASRETKTRNTAVVQTTDYRPNDRPSLPSKAEKNTSKFEVKVLEGMTVTFMTKDGSKTGSIVRVLHDRSKTVLAIPIEDESYAVVFPVRRAADCSFETKQSQGRRIVCQRIGSVRVGNEEVGVGYAAFDSK